MYFWVISNFTSSSHVSCVELIIFITLIVLVWIDCCVFKYLDFLAGQTICHLPPPDQLKSIKLEVQGLSTNLRDVLVLLLYERHIRTLYCTVRVVQYKSSQPHGKRLQVCLCHGSRLC